MTKIRYIGGSGEIELATYGVVKHGEVIDISEGAAKELVNRGNFEYVREPKKKPKIDKGRKLEIKESESQGGEM